MIAIERNNIFMKSILFPFVTVFCITVGPLKALQLNLTYTADGQAGSIPVGETTPSARDSSDSSPC